VKLLKFSTQGEFAAILIIGNPIDKLPLDKAMSTSTIDDSEAETSSDNATEDRGIDAEQSGIVSISGKLPHCFEVTTGKFLDVVIALSPKSAGMTQRQHKELRKNFNTKLYNKTRPGFYAELSESLHFAYAGQPGGHGSVHQWRLFCDDGIKDRVETLILGTALTISGQNSASASGNYTKEWGGLYLRSGAEVRIAEALDKAGVLFFANARGRVGLQETIVSNGQLTGRVEADFLVFNQGKCVVLEVDGAHHSERSQVVRDYARDRVLLRSGVPTVRFTASDCMTRPDEVVAELLSILKAC
jgi:very-short-patch-repair endonuclease